MERQPMARKRLLMVLKVYVRPTLIHLTMETRMRREQSCTKERARNVPNRRAYIARRAFFAQRTPSSFAELISYINQVANNANLNVRRVDLEPDLAPHVIRDVPYTA